MKKKDIQEQTPEQAKEAETGDELRNPEQPPAREQDAPQPPEQGPKEPEGTTRLTGSDEAEHDGIPAYQKRVIVEHIELETKITALSKFIDSPAFMGVDRKEQCRLKNQKQVMQVYASVLKERIDNFKM
ncbi:MAG: crAss001_48 related protein [Planctomycetota bacterium]|jgi:hypothetical protein